MMLTLFVIAGAPGVLGLNSTRGLSGIQQASAQFEQEVMPIFRSKCVACHAGESRQGGLSLESYADLMKGGLKGPAIVPGKSARSRLVLMIEGKVQPVMPLGGKLDREEVEKIRAWINAGAPAPEKDIAVTSSVSTVIPDIKQKARLASQVGSLAFRADGAVLAVAGYQQVTILEIPKGDIAFQLSGITDYVRAVAFSGDGKRLAAAGGEPGRYGEIAIFDTAGRKLIHRLKGHEDYVYSLAFSPDGKMLATSSYDKLIKLWDVETGREIRTLKDHTDAVFPVAFSPDGKWLASGAADRTVKIWDPRTGKRLFTLSDSLDAIYSLAFHPSGKRISAAGADRMIRTWELGPEGGTLIWSTIAHEDEILQIAYSPGGDKLVSTGADRLVKIWDVEKSTELRVLDRQPDWALSIALSFDGSQLAVGRYDGSVSLYDAATGRLVRNLITAP